MSHFPYDSCGSLLDLSSNIPLVSSSRPVPGLSMLGCNWSFGRPKPLLEGYVLYFLLSIMSNLARQGEQLPLGDQWELPGDPDQFSDWDEVLEDDDEMEEDGGLVVGGGDEEEDEPPAASPPAPRRASGLRQVSRGVNDVGEEVEEFVFSDSEPAERSMTVQDVVGAFGVGHWGDGRYRVNRR